MEFIFDLSNPLRLDHVLRQRLPDVSRTRLQQWIKAGTVMVDGRAAARPSQLVEPGSRVVVEAAAAPPIAAVELVPEAMPLAILYEDEDVVVLDKPAGLLVHAGAGQRQGTLVNALLHRYGSLSAGGAHAGLGARPGIVHRLDRGTSGVMLVARNDFAHQHLAEQFRARSIEKRYLALAHGRLRQPQGDITLPILRDRQRRTRMTTRITREGSSAGRAAHTGYRVLERLGGPVPYSWLELDLHTGRTHQIRVHMAALGHPLVGDRMYGAPAELAGPGELKAVRAPRVMLHSSRLAFTQPRSGEQLAFTAPLAADMQDLLARLRLLTPAILNA